ncbi:MAG TPA: ribbon-helix-helix protein, CopG family [Candidatus Saccharimonadales bacterium]|nr:ribbon-helix-helix protein, CopG family [Candidatus Saccharimonadales bacterium]
MPSKQITLRLSLNLLARIDEAAEANLTARSAYIRQAVTMRLNDEHLVPNPKQDDILELLRQSGRRPGSTD